MKRLFSCVLCVFLLIQLCACSPKPTVKLSQKGESVAKRAVNLLDSYLDGEISNDEAKAGMDELKEETDYASDYAGRDRTDEQSGDWKLHLLIMMTSWHVSSDGYNKTAESYEELIKDRNDLAEIVGIKKR